MSGAGGLGSTRGGLAGRLRRLVGARPRLLLSVALGLVLYFALPGTLSGARRFVIAWDAGTLCCLFLVLQLVVTATPEAMRRRARREDEGRWAILILTAAAALASCVAIGAVLQGAKDASGSREALQVALAALTILCSWFFIHVIFALHYAHDYYGDRPHPAAGGLAFPEEKEPDYWDFLYFSLVIGMTCQVSDVQVTSRAMRRTTLGHGVLAFFFNTVVLALSINIAAGLL
jgi:uncharacterized membrane protein